MATTKLTTLSAERLNGVAAGVAAQEYPDWSFIPEPEPVEDFMQQENTMFRIVDALMSRYKDCPDVIVSGGGGYLCYDRADMNARRVPDCMVAFGVNRAAIRDRRGYLIWEVGKPPDVVMEVASDSTKNNDLYDKRALYAELGIGEYWRLDETGGDLYGEPLVGEYLADGEYKRYELHRDEYGRIWSHSEALGLNLFWDGELRWFAIYDPVADYEYLDPEDARQVIATERREREDAQRTIEDRDRTIQAERQAREDAQRELESERRERERERLALETRIKELERQQWQE